MGLLDDAIREHLDLKRRRGADPSEIAREEAEALGPVRREAADEDDAPAGPAADHHAPAALDEPGAAYDDFDEDDDEPEPEAAVEEPDRPRPAEAPTTHERPWAEPEDESATPPHGDPLAHQPTREFSATELGDALGRPDDDAPEPAAGEGEGESEDELDQTPDFLQETPEHDRLWFEQKPPKDFDF